MNTATALKAATLKALNETTYFGEYGDHDSDGNITQQGKENEAKAAIARKHAVNIAVTTATASKALSMATIKASMPDYFARTIGASFDAAYIKGAAVEEYAATLAGVAVEIAHSGNTNGLAFLRSKVDSLKFAKKHAAASVQGTLLARFEGIKKQSLKSAILSDYAEYADSMLCEALAILVPPKADTAPKAKAPNYKALFEAAQAENAALKIDNAALAESLAALRKVGTVTRAAFAPIGGFTSDNPEFTEVE